MTDKRMLEIKKLLGATEMLDRRLLKNTRVIYVLANRVSITFYTKKRTVRIGKEDDNMQAQDVTPEIILNIADAIKILGW